MHTRKDLLLWGAIGMASWLAYQARRAANAYSFRGKMVLITGGSRGLGLVLARRLVQEQARLVICSRNREELSRAYQDLVARGAQVLAVPCDLRDNDRVRDMIDMVHRDYGPI